MLIEVKFDRRGRTSYFYRGLNVPEILDTGIMRYPGCELKVSHWGRKAEDTLVVSRNKMLKTAKPAIYAEITKSVDIAFSKYIKYLLDLHGKGKPLPLNEDEIWALTEAVCHYRTRTKIKAHITAEDDKNTKELYKILRDKIIWTHKGFHINKDQAVTADIEDNKIYGLNSFTDIWYINGDVESFGNETLSFTGPDDIINNDGAGFVLKDVHLKPLFNDANASVMYINRLESCSLGGKTYLLYKLSDTKVHDIECVDETVNNFFKKLFKCIKSSNDKEKDKNKKFCMDKALLPFYGMPPYTTRQKRPILPGFKLFRGVNVTKPPELERDAESSFFNQLGCYFICPLSYEQLGKIYKRIVELLSEKDDEKKTVEELRFINDKTVEGIVNKALDDDDDQFKLLLSFTVENLSSGFDELFQYGKDLNAYEKNEMIKTEVKGHYKRLTNEILLNKIFAPELSDRM